MADPPLRARAAAPLVADLVRGDDVALVVKLTLRLVPHAPATPVAARPLNPSPSDPRAGGPPRDLRPPTRRTEVVFVGSAHPPPGATSARARLAVYRGQTAVLDRTVDLHARGAPLGPTPMRWDLALRTAENPAGSESPILWDGRAPERAACLAPLERPDGSAPPELGLGSLAAGDWLLLDGLVPGQPRLASSLELPAIAAEVRVLRATGRRAAWPIELRPELLVVEGEAACVSVVYRGLVPTHDAVAGVAVVAASEEDLRALDVADTLAALVPASAAPRQEPEAPAPDGTIAADTSAAGAALPFRPSVGEETVAAATAASLGVLPFAAGPSAPRAEGQAAPPVGGTPWEGPASAPAPVSVGEGTLDLSSALALGAPAQDADAPVDEAGVEAEVARAFPGVDDPYAELPEEEAAAMHLRAAGFEGEELARLLERLTEG